MTTTPSRPTKDTQAKKPDSLQREVERKSNELQSLADEIRLKIHLGSMDAKDAWERLEPRLNEFETKAERVSEEIGNDLKQVAATLKTDLQKLRKLLA